MQTLFELVRDAFKGNFNLSMKKDSTFPDESLFIGDVVLNPLLGLTGGLVYYYDDEKSLSSDALLHCLNIHYFQEIIISTRDRRDFGNIFQGMDGTCEFIPGNCVNIYDIPSLKHIFSQGKTSKIFSTGEDAVNFLKKISILKREDVLLPFTAHTNYVPGFSASRFGASKIIDIFSRDRSLQEYQSLMNEHSSTLRSLHVLSRPIEGNLSLAYISLFCERKKIYGVEDALRRVAMCAHPSVHLFMKESQDDGWKKILFQRTSLETLVKQKHLSLSQQCTESCTIAQIVFSDCASLPVAHLPELSIFSSDIFLKMEREHINEDLLAALASLSTKGMFGEYFFPKAPPAVTLCTTLPGPSGNYFAKVLNIARVPSADHELRIASTLREKGYAVPKPIGFAVAEKIPFIIFEYAGSAIPLGGNVPEKDEYLCLFLNNQKREVYTYLGSLVKKLLIDGVFDEDYALRNFMVRFTPEGVFQDVFPVDYEKTVISEDPVSREIVTATREKIASTLEDGIRRDSFVRGFGSW